MCYTLLLQSLTDVNRDKLWNSYCWVLLYEADIVRSLILPKGKIPTLLTPLIKSHKIVATSPIAEKTSAGNLPTAEKEIAKAP